MGALLKLTCLTLLLGITYGQSSSEFDDSFLSPFVDDSTEDWFPSSIFEDFQRMTAIMNQYFKQISVEHDNDTESTKKKLIDVKPVCTTIPTNSNQTSTVLLIQNNRRKRFRTTQTTVCIREKIIDGTKYIQREEKTIDDKGAIISESNDFQSSASSTNNTTAFSSANQRKN